MWIDHAVRGVRDLDEAAAKLEQDYGLASIVGGRHPGWGTGNRIVPLGRAYIELIGIVDPEEAAGDPIGRRVAAAVADGDRWVCWCLATDDLEAAAGRVGLPLDSGSRVRPDGVTLRWRSAGFPFALDNPSLPFFITWDVPPELHPGGATANHRAEPLGISWIEVGEDGRLDRWLEGSDLPVRRVSGRTGLLAVAVVTPSGDVPIS